MVVGSTDENLQVLYQVTGAFNKLGIRYALGGSWASSLLGQPRFTQDADITVDPFPGKEAKLCASFDEDFYLSLPAARQAVSQRSAFNIINTRVNFKVDVFVRGSRPFDESVLDRRVPLPLPESPDPIMLVTAEDIILLKLEWYRLGNGLSDQQWSDILGVLKVQAGRLDDLYLDRWAAELAVSDLLKQARAESVV